MKRRFILTIAAILLAIVPAMLISLIMLIAILTVRFESIKAAMSNPVKSLRSE